ncbi:hypothetical protein BU16DRAFT_584226 [Lophium mytilinum]|uniref:Clr5 domain-containing protein n=1 Tax=Lophium mytilinum TaxID=390894 RepID=A0A6A6QMC5_9PEZI|nr:hypothetical protein BU16DRAFT_584226 [Lophium mytilinum]
MRPAKATLQYAPPTAWDQQKAKISELYETMELKDVMSTMEKEHGFKATKKMYNMRIAKWGLNKRIQASEYGSMIRKKRKRAEEDCGKKSTFILNGRAVPDAKIARFEARAGSQEVHNLISTAPTPPDLICRTPTPSSPFHRSVTPATSALLSPTSSSGSIWNCISWNRSMKESPEPSRFDQSIHSSAILDGTESVDMTMGGNEFFAGFSPILGTRDLPRSQLQSQAGAFNAFLPHYQDQLLFLPHSSPGLQKAIIAATTGPTSSSTFSIASLRHFTNSPWLLQPLESPTLNQSPSLSGTEWWPSFSDFRELRPASRATVTLISQVEDYLRKRAQVLDNYANQMEFELILSQARCETNCEFCDNVGQQRGSKKCRVYHVCCTANDRYRNGKWNLNRSTQFVYAAFQLYFETLSSNRAYLFQLLQFETFLQSYQGVSHELVHIATLAEQDLLTSLGPNHYLTQSAILDVAYHYATSERSVEAEGKVRTVLNEAFDDISALCSHTTFMPDLVTAVRLVTQGHVQTRLGDDGVRYYSCRCTNSARFGEYWYHGESGRLKTGKIEMRVTAFITLCILHQQKGRKRNVNSL